MTRYRRPRPKQPADRPAAPTPRREEGPRQPPEGAAAHGILGRLAISAATAYAGPNPSERDGGGRVAHEFMVTVLGEEVMAAIARLHEGRTEDAFLMAREAAGSGDPSHAIVGALLEVVALRELGSAAEADRILDDVAHLFVGTPEWTARDVVAGLHEAILQRRREVRERRPLSRT